MALKTGLEGKPWYIGLAVGLGVGFVLFALGYWRLLQPMRDEIARQDAKLSELQNKIQEGRAAKQELPKFREEVRQLELELDKLLRILPARRNTPDLMRRIRSLAEQGDFTLKRFTPACSRTRNSSASGRSRSRWTGAITTWPCSSTASAGSRGSSTSRT